MPFSIGRPFFLFSCPLLEGLIEARKETLSSEKTVLPKLKNLGLEKFPVLYSGTATIDIECPSLEHLYVKECPQFSFSTSISDFQSKNQVQLNDKIHMLLLLLRRYVDAFINLSFLILFTAFSLIFFFWFKNYELMTNTP